MNRPRVMSGAPAVGGALVVALMLASLVGGCGSSTTAAPQPGGASATASTAAARPGAGSSAGGAATTLRPVAARPARSEGCSAGTDKPVTGQVVDRTTTSSGVERAYKQWVPSSYDGTTPVPLVIDLHGYMEGAAVHTAMSNLNATAEAKGFVNLTPQGTGSIPFWNSGPSATGPKDLQYISELIDTAGRQYCLDLRKVYVTGLSNGAFMTSLVACGLADKVAAVAPVAGLQQPADCRPARPIPIAAFHGTADQFVTWDGKPGDGVKTLSFNDDTAKNFEGLSFQAIPDALARWADAEGCATPATETPVSASVTLVRYEGCRAGSVVELYKVDGGGHTWPGSQFSGSIANVVGKTTFEIDANQLMWDFFTRYQLPG